MKSLEDIRVFAKQFAIKRDWQKFHSAKNLSMAMAIEASEVMEHFQWLERGDLEELSEAKLASIAEEIADVQVYLVMLADKLEIDIFNAVEKKTQKNEHNYPVEKVRGSSKKYNEYFLDK